MAARKKPAKVAIDRLDPKAVSAEAARQLKAINDHFGPGTMKMASDPSLKIRRLPSGLLTIDDLLSGGVPMGRHTEIYGSAQVGKSAIVARIIARAQADGLLCAYVDAEGKVDPEFLAHLGVNIDLLGMHEQEHGPGCVDFMEWLLRSRSFAVIVLDSISALLPKDEYEKSMDAGSMGMEQAKLMSKAMRKLTAANRHTAIIYINQTRDNVTSMFAKSVTSGGRAMGFYAGTRLEVTKIETLKGKGHVVDLKTGEIKSSDTVPKGHRLQVRVEKESTGSAKYGDTTTLVFDYDDLNFSRAEDLFYLGRKYGLVKKTKKTKQKDSKGKFKTGKTDYYYVDGHHRHRVAGRNAFKDWLDDPDHAEITDELEASIREIFTEPVEDDG